MSARRRYDTVLVANRGEIAARVLEAARGLGLSTIAVYSDADAGAPYLGLADKAVGIGRSPASESYLNAGALIEAARLTGAQAVHPGYGFLSENGAFAKDCAEAGLVFVGPPAPVIEKMSRKDRARRIAEEAGLSVLPAAEGRDDDELVVSVTARIGFPALVKAVAGGGGKAMHVVADEEELRLALRSPAARHWPLSVTRRSSSSVSWSTVVMSRSRSQPTSKAMSSTCSSATAQCSGATRRWSKRPLPRPSTTRSARSFGPGPCTLRAPSGTGTSARSSSSWPATSPISWR